MKKNKIKDKTGYTHRDDKSFYNSGNLELDDVLYFLMNGKRTPQNIQEERWLQEMKAYKRKRVDAYDIFLRWDEWGY